MKWVSRLTRFASLSTRSIGGQEVPRRNANARKVHRGPSGVAGREAQAFIRHQRESRRLFQEKNRGRPGGS